MAAFESAGTQNSRVIFAAPDNSATFKSIQGLDDIQFEFPSLLRRRNQDDKPRCRFALRGSSEETMPLLVEQTQPALPLGLEITTKASAEDFPNNANESGDFEKLIKACSRARDLSTAEEHLAAMMEANIVLTTEAINSVIHVCTRSGRVEAAEKYIEYMDTIGVSANVVTYNSVINACASRADLERAAFWFDRLVARGIAPNEVTYGTLCKVLARHGEAAKIEELMTSLEASGLATNEYFYASLISACMQSEPVDECRAEAALRKMVSRGFSARRVRGPLTRSLGTERAVAFLERVMKSLSVGANETESTAESQPQTKKMGRRGQSNRGCRSGQGHSGAGRRRRAQGRAAEEKSGGASVCIAEANPAVALASAKKAT